MRSTWKQNIQPNLSTRRIGFGFKLLLTTWPQQYALTAEFRVSLFIKFHTLSTAHGNFSVIFVCNKIEIQKWIINDNTVRSVRTYHHRGRDRHYSIVFVAHIFHEGIPVTVRCGDYAIRNVFAFAFYEFTRCECDRIIIVENIPWNIRTLDVRQWTI